MESDDFNLREWCRLQVRESGLTQRQISSICGLTEKTISQMMHYDTGTVEAWQRILNALPHVNRHKLPDVVVNILRLCDYWDKLSKGETPTTKTIRMVIRRGIRYD